MTESLNAQLELARRELLDMGIRGNTLLHFRGGVRTLHVVDERSNQVFDMLVSQGNGKSMSFLPIPDELIDEEDESIDTSPLPDIPEELLGEDRHTDSRLQTRLISDQLDKRLLRIGNEARTFFQEQGVDVLYLALGFLTWYEDQNSSNPRSAPLVLVPVSLDRSTAQERFKICYTDADLGTNLTLAAKLKTEFQIQLPEIVDDFDFDSYLDEVEAAIERESRWEVKRDEIHLGFFSFGKFQMYQDLDPRNWPEDAKPHNHPIIQGLLRGGFPGDHMEGGLNVLGEGPEHDFVHLHLVKDADSSQTEAVLAAKSGSNLVIQGPPGTGKSQTITNIISEALSDGKRVLFVAEKMAALEVVKRRLDECSLGCAVLELHSHKSNKRLVLEELKHTMDLGKPEVEDPTIAQSRYAKIKKDLDRYCTDVNAPILKSGMSYIDALGNYLLTQKRNSGSDFPGLRFERMAQWTKAEFVDACTSAQEITNHLKEMGPVAESVFAKTELRDFTPRDQQNLDDALPHVSELLERLLDSSKVLANEMDLEIPQNLNQIAVLERAANRALAAPHTAGLKLTTDEWQSHRDQISDLLVAGKTVTEIRSRRKGQIIDQGWEKELLKTRRIWATTGQKWWRFLSSEFSRAKSEVQGISKNPKLGSAIEVVDLIDDVLSYQSNQKKYNKHSPVGAALFGAQWQEEKSDWEVLEELFSWVVDTYERIGREELPSGLMRFLEGDHALQGWEPRLNDLASDAADLDRQLAICIQNLGLKNYVESDDAVNEAALLQIREDVLAWRTNLRQLYAMTRYNRLKDRLVEEGMTELAALCDEWQLNPEQIVEQLKYTWFRGLTETAYNERESIRRFDRIAHENRVKEFKQLDKSLFRIARKALIEKHFESLPTAGVGEVGILRAEMNKKRRHMPIRKLLARAGRAVQQVKPVFMMSPMSVATYLMQGSVKFDMVIFDEASQVKVVDALSPLLRGKQAVVVGDTKQMPPTDFFSKTLELDDEEAEESQTADIESILGMFLTCGVPERMLRWHYRSRHDSLITVSNEEFYEGKLMIFPSPGINPNATGLSLRHSPLNLYERGSSSTNPGEALEIAEAVMEHAENRPNLTLGVVAFSSKQRDRILLEVERLRRERPHLEHFFNQQRDDGESFFIKNLENVQGDERDIIYISIGYGHTTSGKVSRSFGPINHREGGHRRLNVLITRAKLSMVVFSNFKAEDLETTNSSPFGVKVLKAFLHFAETREQYFTTETDREPDSPFELDVMQEIKQLGYSVEPQVGVAGYFIDLAIRHPKKLGQYILAVECDGASYHSSAHARYRDRLRQEVLEGLDWSFHRIWSTEWYRNRSSELNRLHDEIKRQIARSDVQAESEPPRGEDQLASPRPIQRDKQTKASFDETLYQPITCSLGLDEMVDLHEQGVERLMNAAVKVANQEAPVHTDEVARRIAESIQISRVGSRRRSAVSAGINLAARNGKVDLRNKFLYLPGATIAVRNREHLAATQKKIELVAPEELEEALIVSAQRAFSINQVDLISDALALLGFQRATENIQSVMRERIAVLLRKKRLQRDGEMLSPAN